MIFSKDDSFDFTVGDINFVIHREPNAEWKLTGRKNENYIMVAVISGAALYTDGESSFQVNEGDILFFRRDECHSAVSCRDNPWSFMTVKFDIIPLGDTSSSLEKIPTVTKSNRFPEYIRLFTKLDAEWNSRSTGSPIKCRSIICNLLYLLIHELAEDANLTSAEKKVIEVKNFLTENYAKSFSTESLAAMAGISNSHFRMLFKSLVGESPLQFQNRLRIAKACELLQSGVCNVTECAYSVGFSDIYYFSRLFKKITGLAPTKYIEN